MIGRKLQTFVFAMVVLSTLAEGQSVQDKLCIFTSAQKLPNIPGLAIVGSRIVDLPGGQKQKKPGDVLVGVEIDVKAAGQDATFMFVCGTAAGQPTGSNLVGLSR